MTQLPLRSGRREAVDIPGSLPVRRAGWGLALLLTLAPALAELHAQGTPAGTRIYSIAQVTYQDQNGESFTVLSDSDGAGFIVAQVGGVDLDPPGASSADPGNTLVFRHTLRNLGNDADSFAVAGHSRAGWAVRVYRDTDGNGQLSSTDPLALGAILLPYGGAAELLVAVDIPGQAAVRGVTDTVRLIAHSYFDPSVADSVADRVQVRSAGIVIALEKAVDRVSATTGDILTYTITYRASGPGSASSFRISDPIPVGTRYVAGTLRFNGAPLTDAPGDDPGNYDPVDNRVTVALPTVSGGETGVVTFQVRIGP